MKKIVPFDKKNVVEVDLSVKKNTQLIKAKKLSTSFSENDFSFTIFVLEELSGKYLLSYEDILVILYLYEIVVFGRKIDFNGGWYLLGNLIDKGFADKDYSIKEKDLYRLSERGIGLVNDYSKGFGNKDKWINENRKIPISDQSIVSSVISDYFK